MSKQIGNYIHASYAKRFSAAAAARSRLNPLSPGTVDNWLRIAARQSDIAHLQDGYVLCLVEKISIQVRLPSVLIILTDSDDDPGG